MRIDIDNNWFIETDSSNCTLYREVVITGEGRGKHLVKEESIGKTRQIAEGYYATVRDALIGYLTREVRRDETKTDILGAIEKMDEIVRRIETMCAKIQQSVPAPCQKPTKPITFPDAKQLVESANTETKKQQDAIAARKAEQEARQAQETAKTVKVDKPAPIVKPAAAEPAPVKKPSIPVPAKRRFAPK